MKKNLKSLIFILFVSSACTSIKNKNSDVDEIFGTKEFAESLVSKVDASWFAKDKRFQLRSYDGEIASHMFFDVDPDINKEDKLLNFVVETPAGSDYGYSIDTLSGQHYFTKNYCSQKDVWSQFDRQINKPNFSIGVVPRVLDQLGKPQKIIVFGSTNYYNKHYKTNYFDARIIGGYIEQVCPHAGCLNQGDWKSKLVLIGVQRDHADYLNVKSYEQLAANIELDYVKAAIENLNGANEVAGNFYPAYRMGAVVDSSQALDFMERNSIFLTKEKTQVIQSSCFKLYEKIWKDVGASSKYENSLRMLNSIETISTKVYTRKLSEINKYSKNLFYKRFIRNFEKYEKNYKTCIKYVYPSNLNVDMEKHLFFTYYTAVHLLHGLHYSYDCGRKVWMKNHKILNGKRIIPKGREFVGCSSTQVDSAFTQAVIYLNSLYENSHASYRYIDYDKGARGSHEKLYSWVPVDNKKMKCIDGSQDDKKLYNLFPKDFKWKKRTIRDRLNKRMIF